MNPTTAAPISRMPPQPSRTHLKMPPLFLGALGSGMSRFSDRGLQIKSDPHQTAPERISYPKWERVSRSSLRPDAFIDRHERQLVRDGEEWQPENRRDQQRAAQQDRSFLMSPDHSGDSASDHAKHQQG